MPLPACLPLPPGWPEGAGSRANPGPRSTSARHPMLLETLQLLLKKLGPLPRGVTLSPIPKMSAQQASTCIPACLPAVLTGQHCHLLPAARQDTPALPVPPSPGPPPALLAGDCVPAGALQHRVPQALGQHPRHRVHQSRLSGMRHWHQTCGQHGAHGSQPSSKERKAAVLQSHQAPPGLPYSRAFYVAGTLVCT